MKRSQAMLMILAVSAAPGACTSRMEYADSSRAAAADAAPGAVAGGEVVNEPLVPARPESAGKKAPTNAAARTTTPRPATAGRTTPPDSGPRRIMVGTLDVTDLGYDRGSPSAPVVVVEFSDFGCPYCAEFAIETFPAIDSLYIATGKVRFKYIPFLTGTFRHSAEATRAMECVVEQRPDQVWLVMTRLYETQPAWKGRGSPDAMLRTVARSVNVDSTQFAGCYADDHTDSRTKAGTDAADRVGVWVTPSFVVNQRPVQGALPLAEFRKVIDAELRRAPRRR